MDPEEINLKKERSYFSNTLACVVKGVTGLYTTVDLRNDSFVSGKVEHVDGYMNITLSDAVFTDLGGKEHYFDFFFVRQRNVRYVCIPSEVNIKDTLVEQIKPRKPKPARPLTAKMKRTLLRQQETLQRVQKIKEERLKLKKEKEGEA